MVHLGTNCGSHLKTVENRGTYFWQYPTLNIDRIARENSGDPDQTAP